MFFRFLILTLLPFVLFANEVDRKEVLTDLFQTPSGVVADCVNVITGHYFLTETDFYVPGPNPIAYQLDFAKIQAALAKLPITQSLQWASSVS